MTRQAANRKTPAESEFTIRKATEADLDILVEQRISMYRDMLIGIRPNFRGYRRRYGAWALNLMKRKKLISFLVTDSKGFHVAGGSIWIREVQPSPRYEGTEQPYLMSMYTDPRYRGKGLATMLVKHTIKWSREHGYPRLSLHASNMGEPVYAKEGFERTTEMRLNLASPPEARPLRRSGRGTGLKRRTAPSFIKRADSNGPQGR